MTSPQTSPAFPGMPPLEVSRGSAAGGQSGVSLQLVSVDEPWTRAGWKPVYGLSSIVHATVLCSILFTSMDFDPHLSTQARMLEVNTDHFQQKTATNEQSTTAGGN